MKKSYIDRGGGLMVDVIAKLGKRVYLKKESETGFCEKVIKIVFFLLKPKKNILKFRQGEVGDRESGSEFGI